MSVIGNLFRDSKTYAVYYDNTFTKARISRNVVVNCKTNAIMLEMNEPAVEDYTVIDNNVVINTVGSGTSATDPHGVSIYAHDNDGVIIAHNLLLNPVHFNIYTRHVLDRKGTADYTIIKNNLMFAEKSDGQINIPWVYENNESDYNIYWPSSKRFVFNTYAKTHPMIKDKAGMMKQVEDAVGTSLDCWGGCDKGRWLTFSQWQKAKGFDKNSRQANISNLSFDKNSMTLKFDIDGSINEVAAEKLAGIDTDFAGNAIPASGARAGPFQNIKQGTNTFSLWSGAGPDVNAHTAKRTMLPQRSINIKVLPGKIIVSDALPQTDIILYNAQGAIVARANSKGAIKTSHLPAGAYIVRAKSAAMESSKQVNICR
jgi:hypothetical protein